MRSFFGDCDKEKGNPHGKIVNTNPLWTKDKNIADMKDNVRDIEQQEATVGFVDGKARAKKLARKTKLVKTLSQIKASDPRGKVQGGELDEVGKAVVSFEEEIRNLNPTRYDDEQAMKGKSVTVNPALQGHRSKTPCIKLKSEGELAFAKSCNMKINENNEVSRDDMTRGLWLGERILGIRPDHNRLKRDIPHGHIRNSGQFQVGDLPNDMQTVSTGNVFNNTTENITANLNKEEEKTESVDIKPVKGNRVPEKRAKRTGKPWTCPDCESKMTTLQKGLHKRHCANVKELVAT